MNQLFLSLGSNLGNREENLLRAKEQISAQIGDITQASALYDTEPWGLTAQELFLNQVIMVSTEKTPAKTLHILLGIEENMGRKRLERWGPRLIDLDILLYDDMIINSEELTVPHPEMHKRRFILEPIMQLAPYKIHPALHKSMLELYENLEDPLGVHQR